MSTAVADNGIVAGIVSAVAMKTAVTEYDWLDSSWKRWGPDRDTFVVA